MKLAKVIGVRKPENSEMIGKIVEVIGLVNAGTEIDGAGLVKPDTGYKCVYGITVKFFHPDDLEEVE